MKRRPLWWRRIVAALSPRRSLKINLMEGTLQQIQDLADTES